MMDVEAAGAATQGDRGFLGAGGDAGRDVGKAPIWDEDTLDPKVVHEYLTALARDDAARDHLRGQWLLKGLLSRVWVPLGYGSFHEYVERVFGYSPRVTEERIRVARCLQRLPRLDEALRRGELCFSVVKEVTRVAVPDTEAAWLDAVRGKSVREVEGMVSERDRGDDPDRPPRPRPRRHVLRFEVQEETRAMVREARKVAIRDAGHGLSDDELLQLMARALVRVSEQAASSEPAAPAYQVHMTVCEQCGQGHVVGGGCKAPVRDAVVAAAKSDAVIVPARGGTEPPRGGSPAASATEPPRGGKSAVSASEPPRGGGSTAGQPPRGGNPAASATEPPRGGNPASGQPPRGGAHGTGRARKTIPEKTRRQVWIRDEGRCRVPGCRHHAFLDLHHHDPVAEGGDDDPDNLMLLCSTHHVAVHEGRLVIERLDTASAEGPPEYRFLHADGREYGAVMPPHPVRDASSDRPRLETVATYRRAFSALRGLGFGQREIDGALAAVRDGRAAADATPDTEAVVRAALRRLTAGIVTARDDGPGYVAAPVGGVAANGSASGGRRPAMTGAFDSGSSLRSVCRSTGRLSGGPSTRREASGRNA